MNIIVTGGAGFIGSHFIWQFLAEHPDSHITCVDNLTYAADLSALEGLPPGRFKFVQMDICDPKFVDLLIDVRTVYNFAAESHVDNSIANSDPFITTNVNGTHNLLKCLLEARKKFGVHIRFVQISTDEVYGSMPDKAHATEEAILRPSSPYSASKAAADLMVQSYNRTFGLETVITRSTNNYGPRQNIEKFIPNIIVRCLKNEEVVIYDDGKNIRDWVYVTDNCRGVMMAGQTGFPGHIYNIGYCGMEVTNLGIYTRVCNLLDKPKGYKTAPGIRPGHDFRYAVSTAKINKELGWVPLVSLEEGLIRTVDWYVDHFTPPSPVVSDNV